MQDAGKMSERGLVVATTMPHDSFAEDCLRATVHKYKTRDVERAFTPKGYALEAGLIDSALFPHRGVEPYEICEGQGNALVYGGASAFFDLLIGAANVTAFNNANAYLGVGDSTTAWAVGQTDLQAATNKNRQGQETSYPSHTDGVTSANDSCDWKSQWGTSQGNFAWQEWALFNAASAGRMLQRKVESFGTKSSSAIWTLTITLSLS